MSGDDADLSSLFGYGLLEGVTVVEVASELTEYAGTVLAGLGAKVWLVEPPGGGPTRERRPFVEHGTPSRRSIPFVARNVGKRSVVIDSCDDGDRHMFGAVLATADVVLEHESSPWATLSAASGKPVVRVVDPRGAGVSPLVVFAASGSLSSSGWPHQPPCNAPSWLALDAVGTFAAVLAVLMVRDHRLTGRSQLGEVPLMEAGIAGLTNWTRTLYSYGTATGGQGAETKRMGSGPFPIFPCSDGYVRVIASRQDQWEAFVELLDRPPVLLDPMWDSFQFRLENYDLVFTIAAELLQDRRANEVFHRGQALGLPITPVLDLAGVLTDEHVRSRRVLVQADDPDLGPVVMLRPPLRTADDGDLRPLAPAPALGEHQAELPASGEAVSAAGSSRSGGSDIEAAGRLPLAGVRVLSFGVGAVIPEATSLLALLGAEVIKVESQYGLDFFRQIGSDVTGDINQSPTFNQANLGVESCCINAASDEGRAVLQSLVARCDILMENMRGPVMKKFGMDYPSVAAVKPDIIYMSSQGLGPGRYETYLTYGPNLQSFAGMTSIWAHPDDPYPVGSTLSFPDMQAGKQGLVAVLAALMRRDATGEGCYLDCAQFESCLWSIADKFLQHQVLGDVVPLGNRSLDYAPHACYPCAGVDQWCAVSVDNDDQWACLVSLLGDPQLGGKEMSTLEGRLARLSQIDAAVAAWTRIQTPGEAVERLRAAGVSASIIVDGESQAHDAELHESGFYTAVAHPRSGVDYYTGLPFLLDGRRFPVRRAPLIGEHTEYVMLDLLGTPSKELSRLVAEKYIGT